MNEFAVVQKTKNCRCVLILFRAWWIRVKSLIKAYFLKTCFNIILLCVARFLILWSFVLRFPCWTLFYLCLFICAVDSLGLLAVTVTVCGQPLRSVAWSIQALARASAGLSLFRLWAEPLLLPELRWIAVLVLWLVKLSTFTETHKSEREPDFSE